MSMLMIQILSRDMTSQMKISKWLENRDITMIIQLMMQYNPNLAGESRLACHIICMYNVARLS